MKLRVFILLFYLFSSLHLLQAQEDYVEHELLVKLRNNVSLDALYGFLDSHPAFISEVDCLFKTKGVYSLKTKEADPRNLIEAMKNEDLFEIVQLNHKGVLKRETIPSDGNYAAQWYMRQIQAESAWDISIGGVNANGDSIVIAVVDEGFDLNHLDLNYFKNENEIPGNGIDDDSNGYVDDYDGWNAYDNNGNLRTESHGTMVAGAAAAIGNNREGIAGVNWNAKILPVLGLSSDEATVVRAYSYVYEMRRIYNETNGDSGAYVVVCNSSFGIDRAKPADYPLWCDMYESMGEQGILNVAATANWSQNIDIEGDIPTTCPSDYLIAVTSTNKTDQISTSPGAAFGPINIDIAAPGVDIFSTTINSNYTSKNGTSYAAPLVTGAIALMHSALCSDLENLRENHPDSLALILRDYLLQDGVDKLAQLGNKVASEGRLNLYKSLAAVYNCYPVSIKESLENEGNQYLVYPNPSNGSFQVTNNSAVKKQMKLVDLNGRIRMKFELAENNPQLIEFNNPGVYLLIEEAAQKQNFQKIVIY